MKDLKATISMFCLTILANLVTPSIAKLFEESSTFNIHSYWYIFVISVLLAGFFDVTRILLDKDKSDLWRAHIAYLAILIYHTKKNEKKYIINDLNGRINLARRELHFTNTLLPRLVQVEWVDKELSAAETYDLKDGEFIVRVSNKDSQQKNIVDIVHATTKRTSFVGIRHVISNNKPFEESLDEVMSENIILKINNRHILDFYYCEHLRPCLQADHQLQRYYGQAKIVDNLGMFFPIYLTELEYFSKRITGQPYRPFLLGEVEQFLEFLCQVRPEKTSYGVDLQFEKAFLKTGVLLIRSEKIVRVGIANYLKMVDTYLEREYNSFYLVYFEKRSRQNWRRFQQLVNNLIAEITLYATIEKDFDKHYSIHDSSGNLHEARCLRFIVHARYALERVTCG